MTAHLDQIQRVREALEKSQLSPDSIRLAQEQLDSAKAAAASTNGDTPAAILSLCVMNAATLVNNQIDAGARDEATKAFVADQIKAHKDGCQLMFDRIPQPKEKNPDPILKWPVGEIWAAFISSRWMHTTVISALLVASSVLMRPSTAPTASIAAVAPTAAVAAQSPSSADVLRQLAGQIALELAQDMKSNGVSRMP